jgi:hypothetical protein
MCLSSRILEDFGFSFIDIINYFIQIIIEVKFENHVSMLTVNNKMSFSDLTLENSRLYYKYLKKSNGLLASEKHGITFSRTRKLSFLTNWTCYFFVYSMEKFE